MKKHMHLNLIKDKEIVSSNPIRARVIAPIISIILAVSIFGWWLLLFIQYINIRKLNTHNNETNSQLQAAYNKVLALSTEEKVLTALIAQLNAYETSKIVYGESFARIPEYVVSNIQFTSLELLKPPNPLTAKNKESAGPTNTTESATFVITGKTSSVNALKAVEQLLKALQDDQFTNLIQSAHIPKGSFRQDTTPQNGNKEFLRFEIECNCTPRRFE